LLRARVIRRRSSWCLCRSLGFRSCLLLFFLDTLCLGSLSSLSGRLFLCGLDFLLCGCLLGSNTFFFSGLFGSDAFLFLCSCLLRCDAVLLGLGLGGSAFLLLCGCLLRCDAVLLGLGLGGSAFLLLCGCLLRCDAVLLGLGLGGSAFLLLGAFGGGFVSFLWLLGIVAIGLVSLIRGRILYRSLFFVIVSSCGSFILSWSGSILRLPLGLGRFLRLGLFGSLSLSLGRFLISSGIF